MNVLWDGKKCASIQVCVSECDRVSDAVSAWAIVGVMKTLVNWAIQA